MEQLQLQLQEQQASPTEVVIGDDLADVEEVCGGSSASNDMLDRKAPRKGRIPSRMEAGTRPRLPGTLREIVLAERRDGSEPASEVTSPLSTVCLDSDTRLPADLYRDLLCAGARARCRGQHRVTRGNRNNPRPHLERSRASSLPRLSPASTLLESRYSSETPSFRGWNSVKSRASLSVTSRTSQKTVSVALSAVGVGTAEGELCLQVNEEVVLNPIGESACPCPCTGIVIDSGDDQCREVCVSVGDAGASPPDMPGLGSEVSLARRRRICLGPQPTGRTIVSAGKSGPNAAASKLPPLAQGKSNPAGRIVGFFSNYVMGAAAKAEWIPGSFLRVEDPDELV